MTMVLGERFKMAVGEALRLHATQKRKGTDIPYAAHLLSTASLVLQFGGDEDQAIAGLLHDAVEDAGGRNTLNKLRDQFGPVVADIVEGCTDTFEDPKPAWRVRKEKYIASIPGKPVTTLLVSACDKLDNARAIVADLRRDGVETLARFTSGPDTPWYYRTITDQLRAAGKGTPVEHVARELDIVVRQMERLVGSRRNTHTNELPQGVTEEQIQVAIERSGYPLQGVVAALLASRMTSVQEEWSYIDRDTGALRALDLYATKLLYDRSNCETHARPALDVLIECKQSELPVVFFRGKPPTWQPDIPLVAGLRDGHVGLKTGRKGATLSVTVQECLSLHGLPFAEAPHYATTLSKVARKGKELEVTGSEPYNEIVLPLVKALLHLKRAATPKKTYAYFDCIASIAVAVLDAPMMLVEVTGPGEFTSTPASWVRLHRQEAHLPEEGGGRAAASRRFAIDFIHREFFATYLDEHLLPFAARFAERVLRNEEVLAAGTGFVTQLETFGQAQRDLWRHVTSSPT